MWFVIIVTLFFIVCIDSLLLHDLLFNCLVLVWVALLVLGVYCFSFVLGFCLLIAVYLY